MPDIDNPNNHRGLASGKFWIHQFTLESENDALLLLLLFYFPMLWVSYMIHFFPPFCTNHSRELCCEHCDLIFDRTSLQQLVWKEWFGILILPTYNWFKRKTTFDWWLCCHYDHHHCIYYAFSRRTNWTWRSNLLNKIIFIKRKWRT